MRKRTNFTTLEMLTVFWRAMDTQTTEKPMLSQKQVQSLLGVTDSAREGSGKEGSV